MQRKKHLSQNKFGVYYYRFTLPKWHIERFPEDKKSIFLSLRTKNIEVARIRLDRLRMMSRILLTKIKNQYKLSHMTDNKTINEILREYCDYLAHDETGLADELRFGSTLFDHHYEYVEKKLFLLRELGLLNFVDTDLGNLDELHLKAKTKAGEIKSAEIEAVLNQKSKSISEKSSSPKAETKTEITLSQLMEYYASRASDDIRLKTMDKIRGHIEFLIETVGDIRVTEFNQKHLRSYIEKLDKRCRIVKGEKIKISNSTKNDHLGSCRKLFDKAVNFHDSKIHNYFKSKTILFKHKD